MYVIQLDLLGNQSNPNLNDFDSVFNLASLESLEFECKPFPSISPNVTLEVVDLH